MKRKSTSAVILFLLTTVLLGQTPNPYSDWFELGKGVAFSVKLKKNKYSETWYRFRNRSADTVVVDLFAFGSDWDGKPDTDNVMMKLPPHTTQEKAPPGLWGSLRQLLGYKTVFDVK